MSVFEYTRQEEIGTHFMALSKPMIGHIIPGIKVVYPVTTYNHPDLKEDVRHRKKPIDPVVRFPGQSDPHSKGHPMMEKLKAMLSKDHGKMRPGYDKSTAAGFKTNDGDSGFTRIKEDLSWRGQGHLVNRAHM
jgi:hypothetical protein